MTMVLRFLPRKHPLVLDIIYMKARIANAMGIYKISYELMEISLEGRRKIWAGNHPAVADSLYGVAEVRSRLNMIAILMCPILI
jgi:1-acyl-sn-glycerol-3-phosphate acyltransferase